MKQIILCKMDHGSLTESLKQHVGDYDIISEKPQVVKQFSDQSPLLDLDNSIVVVAGMDSEKTSQVKWVFAVSSSDFPIHFKALDSQSFNDELYIPKLSVQKVYDQLEEDLLLQKASAKRLYQGFSVPEIVIADCDAKSMLLHRINAMAQLREKLTYMENNLKEQSVHLELFASVMTFLESKKI